MPESQEEQLQVAGVLIGSCLRELELKFGKLSKELEHVKMREAEIIAKAKEEQREMDAVAGKEWAMELCEESWKPESIFNAIRNKE